MLLLASAGTWLITKRINTQKGRLLVDEQTGKKILLKKKHTFFYIPVRYWVFILIVAAIVVFLVKAFKIAG
ncbi:hypothetical protein [Thiomonas sp.]